MHNGRDMEGVVLTIATAQFLRKKFVEAQKYKNAAVEVLRKLEGRIKEKYGEATLEQYMREEADFQAKVVHLHHHKDLKNPYDLPRPTRKCISTACTQALIFQQRRHRRRSLRS